MTISGRHIPTWCGLECTVARIGDRARNQFDETGHTQRGADDVRRLADVGFEAIRYPIHWEIVRPTRGEARNWSWYDNQLANIRATKMQVIAGLVHHGSGPRHTDLLDDRFAPGLAAHAGEVARRYPWIADYTPVNEPLTTARFSALYGHWYPHARHFRDFCRAVLVQCEATRAAMKAIRQVRPDARLVQTEDLGRVFGEPALRCQIEHENLRRWLSLDLLCGRVDPRHPFWQEMTDHGIEPRWLASFLDDPCPPDIIGINHYLSSDRFLDDRIERYAAEEIGSNGWARYADVAASMVAEVSSSDIGWLPRLREAWERYGLPIALTEVHNGCTREEQLRWVEEATSAAYTLQAEGVDIRAITAWSAFGAVDWASLLVREDGVYEPGLFDASASPPRRTALAHEWRMISRPDFSLAERHGPGWWRRNRACETDRQRAPSAAVVIVGDNAMSRAMLEVAFRRGLHAVHWANAAAATRHLAVAPRKGLGIVYCAPIGSDPAADPSRPEPEIVGDCPIVAFSERQDAFTDRGGFSKAEVRLIERGQVLLVRVPPDKAGRASGHPDVTEAALDDRRQLADRILDLLIDRAWGLWQVVPPATHRGRASRGPLLSRVAHSDAVQQAETPVAATHRPGQRRAGR